MNKPSSADKFPDLVYPVVSIRDALSGFLPLTCEQNENAAIRNFAMAINQNTGVMGFSPSDFALFHVANFNVEKGTVEPVSPIVELASGLSVIGAKNEES